MRNAVLLTILATMGLAGAPATADAYIYYSNTGSDAVGRTDLDGTDAIQSFFTGANDPEGVAVNGLHVFWANSGNGTIGRGPINGAVSEVNQSFIAGASTPRGIALGPAHIYWTNDTGAIGRANLTGTSPNQSFITGASAPRGVAVDGGHVYWSNSAADSIGRANLDGTGVDHTFITGADEPNGVAVNGSHIYWANAGSNSVGRADLDGGNVNQSLITGAMGPTAVSLDPTHVYWANPSENSVGRADLDGGNATQTFITGTSASRGVAVAQPHGEASVVGGVLTFQGADDTENRAQINSDGASWNVLDDRGPVVAGPGCVQQRATANCAMASVTSVEAHMGDLEDHMRATVTVPTTMYMEEGGDQVRGGSVADTLIGGPGDDNLEGRDGTDILDGGDGTHDTALYILRTASQPVDVTLDGLANDGGAEDSHADQILTNVEDVNATPGDDTIVGDGGPNRLTGGSGTDAITGGAGADNIFGQAGNDTLTGEAGNDSLDGGDGADLYDGGANTDTARYTSRTAVQPVSVTINNVANDGGALDGNADNLLDSVENVNGGSGNDTLTGSAGANSLVGAAGRDVLDGGAGADSLDGASDVDTARYGTRTAIQPVTVTLDSVANDGGALDGNADNVRSTVEHVTGGAGNDTITGSNAANTLTGNGGADTLGGAAAADTLAGGDGTDSLSGGSDRDSLDGGLAADLMDGGTERDSVRYSSRGPAEPVTVTLDGVADDGGALDGNADNAVNAESIVGGAGDDHLIGNAGDNVLTGNAGVDELFGFAGNDELRANGDGPGDTINCGFGGKDHVFPDPGDSVPGSGADACEIVH